jgi:hypothetical protein
MRAVGRDVPDWDDTEKERDEDAAWRDLVARFDAPLTAQEPAPWPAREDEDRGSRRADGWHMADSRRAADGLHGGLEGFGADGTRGAFDADGMPEVQDPDMIEALRRIWGPGAGRMPGRGVRGRATPDGKAGVLGSPADDDGEHFIPPAPPPLPKLDPLAKGAWAALFGGPGYLVVATAAGWSVSGFAAFCAVAAFVAGFAILVLRMNDPGPTGPGGPDDGDDGAVV